MVLILDGSPEHIAQCEEKQVFLQNDLIYATSLDINKYLKKIKFSSSPYTCATISELTSIILPW